MASTEAIAASEEVKATVLSVASVGSTVAVSLPTRPSVRVRAVLSRAMPATGMVTGVTVTAHWAVFYI